MTAAEHPGGARPAGAEVGAGHDVGVEQGDEGFEVAGPSGGEEGVDHGALTGGVALRGGDLGSLDAAAGPAGELPGRLGRASDHGGDLVERQVEHVVEHEGEALRRPQGVDHDLEGEADRVGEQHLLLGVGSVGGAHDRVRDVGLEWLLQMRVPGTEQVEADPGDDRREPGLQVVDVVGAGAVDPLPGVLDGVVGLEGRAQHSVGHGSQVGPVLLESPGEPLAVAHHASHRSLVSPTSPTSLASVWTGAERHRVRAKRATARDENTARMPAHHSMLSTTQ